MKNNIFEFDLVRFVRLMLADKKGYLITLLISAVVAVIVAFSIPRIYKTNVKLAPETSSGGMMSSLSSIASMVGLSEKELNSDAIYPDIYPELMSSMDFITSLFPIKVVSKDGKINTTYYDYLDTKQKSAWWDYPKLWAIKAMKALRKDEGKSTTVNPKELTRDQFNVAKAILNTVNCQVDKKTSVINISVTAQDAKIAATIADSVKNRLQDCITEYRTNKARQDVKYMEKIYEEAKNRYVKARQRYGAFGDSHQDILLESVKSVQEDLENDMQLQYNIYTQVEQQLRMAEAKVQENTPAFTVLQPSSVPVKHSNMPKIFILALFLLLGFFIRTCVLIYKNRNTLIAYKS